MKLKSPLRKDAADVVELVKAGADKARIAEYIANVAPGLTARFQALALEAEAE
jgi:hypothetical protein